MMNARWDRMKRCDQLPFFYMLKHLASLVVCFLLLPCGAFAQNPYLVTYEGTKGPGAGKHIVLLSGDHEYRS